LKGEAAAMAERKLGSAPGAVSLSNIARAMPALVSL
jgi:hypothetical protein